jgi:eukaryotic-like serine/threonine-protein kinase
MGTPRYTPPEAFDGANADPRWDLYALGIMLYESLTGKPGYTSTTMYSLMHEVMNDPLPPVETKVDNVSSEFSDFIGRLIELDSDKRPATAEVALEELKELEEVRMHDELDTPTVTIPRMRPIKTKPNSRKNGWE